MYKKIRYLSIIADYKIEKLKKMTQLVRDSKKRESLFSLSKNLMPFGDIKF